LRLVVVRAALVLPCQTCENADMGPAGSAPSPIGSAGSILSIGSAGSILSIGSAGSILSIGSAGSILSIGSAGSILSVGSAGSILSILSAISIGTIFSARARWAMRAHLADHLTRRVGKRKLTGEPPAAGRRLSVVR
jgi:hypothetical protein